MNEEKKPFLIINEEYDEIQINIKHTKPYMKLQQENEQLKQENTRLKDKIKDLEEWLEAMASMYENEYKDVNASEHYKCMLHKLKEN